MYARSFVVANFTHAKLLFVQFAGSATVASVGAVDTAVRKRPFVVDVVDVVVVDAAAARVASDLWLIFIIFHAAEQRGNQR